MLRRSDPRWAYVLVNLATLLWASNIVLGRFLRHEIGPLSLSAARFSVAGLIFLLLLRKTQKNQALIDQPLGSNPRQPPRMEWLLYLGMSLVGVFGFTTLLYFALRYTTASHAAVINAATPLVTAVLAAVFLKEQFTRPLLVGSILSLAGVGLVIGVGTTNIAGSPQALFGDLLCLVAAVLWGIYSILGRLATKTKSSLQVTAFSIWFALPLLYLAAGVEWQTTPPSLTSPVLLAAVYIGVFPSVIAFSAWNEGVRMAGPNQAMAFYNMLPVYGTLLGVLLLGESLSWNALFGGILVIAGGIMIARLR